MDEREELEQLKAEFPDWTITRAFGCYRAVPKGSPFIEAVYLDSLRGKLADHEWDEPPRRRAMPPWLQPVPDRAIAWQLHQLTDRPEPPPAAA